MAGSRLVLKWPPTLVVERNAAHDYYCYIANSMFDKRRFDRTEVVFIT